MNDATEIHTCVEVALVVEVSDSLLITLQNGEEVVFYSAQGQINELRIFDFLKEGFEGGAAFRSSGSA